MECPPRAAQKKAEMIEMAPPSTPRITPSAAMPRQPQRSAVTSELGAAQDALAASLGDLSARPRFVAGPGAVALKASGASLWQCVIFDIP